MSSVKCSKCGWEYPVGTTRKSCIFCKGGIRSVPDGVCACCGKPSDNLHNGRCRACHTADHAAWRQRRVYNAKESFDGWLKKIADAPTKPMTEAQWMKACKHFGGCAYCGEQSIDARSMFIPFKLGGRYCSWNIVPACEKCETSVKTTPNPFTRMDNVYRRANHEQAKKLGYTLENLNKIVDYLQNELEVKDEGM